MPATSADNSILATGRPVRIPTPDDPSGFPNYYRNFRLTTLAGRIPLSANFVRLSRLPGFHGFIATEAEVPSVFASRYGMTFLRHLSRGGNPWEILSTRCVEKGACFRLICSIHACGS